MYTLIDKFQETALTANIPTVGYQTLICIVNNGASGASNYEGTKAEAKALIDGMTIKMADATEDTGVDLDKQYIKARTIAGTKHAVVELVLTKAYIKTLTLGTNITAVAKLLTLPANSVV